MFVGMAAYSLGHIGARLGAILQRVTRRDLVLDKTACGTTDTAQWSRMIHGACSLDLNRVYQESDSHTLARFFASVLKAKVDDEQQQQKERVA